MLNILFHYYYYNYTDFSNDILVQEDTINPSRTVKQMRWVCSGEVKFQTNLTNKQKLLLQASVICYIPKLSQGKQTYWTHGQCLLQWDSGNVSDKLSLFLSHRQTQGPQPLWSTSIPHAEQSEHVEWLKACTSIQTDQRAERLRLLTLNIRKTKRKLETNCFSAYFFNAVKLFTYSTHIGLNLSTQILASI